MKTMIAIAVLTLTTQAQNGTIYCTSNPNVTGQVAHMGFCQPTQDSMCLTNATPNGYAQLMCGTTPMNVPFANGTMCINPFNNYFRVGTPVQVSPEGTASTFIPWQTLNTNSTLYFQWLYRDIQPSGYTFNTSNALRWPN
jgi:hypothetical protein